MLWLSLLTSCSSPSSATETPVDPAPVAASTKPPAEASWPADKAALESQLPTKVLGASSPLISRWGDYEEAYGNKWELTAPATIAGVPCKDTLEVKEKGWSCLLSAPYTFSVPSVTQRAGTVANFTYGEARPSRLTLSELEPETSTLVVDGTPCTKTVDFRDGKLAGCVLAADHAFGMHVLPKGAELEKTEFGTLQVCVETAMHAPMPEIEAGTCFIIDEDGNIDIPEGGFGP